MLLVERIDQDLIDAMKSGDQFKRDTLRYLKSNLKQTQVDQQLDRLSDDQAVTIIQKEVKRRREAVESFTVAGKPDLAAKEQQEIELLQTYLPAQMSEADITAYIQKFLSEHPANPDQIGPTIGQLSGQLKGKADLSQVAKLTAEIVRNQSA